MAYTNNDSMSTANTTSTNAKSDENTIINTLPNKHEFNSQVKQSTKSNDKDKRKTPLICCPCYDKHSFDARCCGACYYCCPVKDKTQQCAFCPSTFTIYWNSGYVQTDTGYGIQEKNGIYCWCCFPIKFPIFFVCFLGSICNSFINSIRDTELNYLC